MTLPATAPLPVIVTITDPGYALAVFLLVLSLKRHRVRARIHVLGVRLSDCQREWFRQFPEVRLFDADLANPRNPATRKGEAILTAAGTDAEFITLLDGDCLATGNITPYLSPPEPAFYARHKAPAEDARMLARHYTPDDERGTIPRRMLAIWRQDVGERDTPAISNTVCGGNLTLHRSCLPFIRKWHAQMMNVLPLRDAGHAYDFDNYAYSQLDESVLNSLLAFAADAPPLRRGLLDQDPLARVAHLGPNNPRPWQLWRLSKIRHLNPVLDLLDWGARQGYRLPPLPWTFRRRNKPLIWLAAWGFEAFQAAKSLLRPARVFYLTHWRNRRAELTSPKKSCG